MLHPSDGSRWLCRRILFVATVRASVNVSEALCFFASTKLSLQFTRQPPQSQLNPQQLISHEGIRHVAALWVLPDALTPDAQNGSASVNGRWGMKDVALDRIQRQQGTVLRRRGDQG